MILLDFTLFNMGRKINSHNNSNNKKENIITTQDKLI